MTNHYDDCERIVDHIIAHVGKTIMMAAPLGIGKPIGVLNALYQRACADPSINLTILTALTLSRPTLKSELEKRFIEPILKRLVGDYIDPLYEKDRQKQQLPKNVKIIEFYLTPGQYLHNDTAQQDYISSIYTRVVRDGLHYKINVYGQQVAQSKTDASVYSLSSNSDLFHELCKDLRHAEKQGRNIVIFAEVNQSLPFMLGENAVITNSKFSDIVDTHSYPALFALPRDELSVQDHLIGLYTSCLIKDGGSLQIGIGKLSNALANAMIFRHNNNALYQNLLQRLQVTEKFGHQIAKNIGGAPGKKRYPIQLLTL